MIITEGSTSPWGEVQTALEIEPGIYWVDTPGHGGFMVHKAVFADHNLGREILELNEYGGTHDREFYCFEEDCEWTLLFLEMHAKGFSGSFKGTWLHPEKKEDREKLYKDAVNCLIRYYPVYAARCGYKAFEMAI